MNQDWTVTYKFRTGTKKTTFTAAGILDAIQQCLETGVTIVEIVGVESDEKLLIG